MNALLLFLIAALAGAPGHGSGTNPAPGNPARPSGAVLEKEYDSLLEKDDAAREEVDKWIRDAESFALKGADSPYNTLQQRIKDRFLTVEKGYEDFLRRNPNHARARLAFGSFLQETGHEEQGVEMMEKARQLDPENAAAWNNLANHYGHRGPVKKAFEYYGKALQLAPEEPLYYWNFATTVYLFRKDAMEFFNINEQEVFDKALELYRQAVRRDPTNFVLATDYSESFYGTNPPRYLDGLKAWTETMKIARDEVEREGVHIHLGRININLGRFDEARAHLDSVTNAMYAGLKDRLGRKLAKEQEEKQKKKTSSLPSPAPATD